MQHRTRESAHTDRHEHGGHYARLLAMTVLSFLAMYILMYAMVDRAAHVFHNLNQVYMAGLMAAPMALIELVLMRGMYRNRVLNATIAVGALALMLLCWLGIRAQWAITDQQFIRSMIPHHAGAILMCEKNQLRDPGLQQLCREIVQSQREEIARMEAELR